MKPIVLVFACLLLIALPGVLLPLQSPRTGGGVFRAGGGVSPLTNEPQFGADNELQLPQNYREWIWLSSGLGMSYGPAARTSTNPPFDNVFVTPEAYRAFQQSGTWPDKTMFVLELRSSMSQGSINKQGHFQGDVIAIEVEVKDEKRFPGKWAFFDFGRARTTAKPLPASAECYSCHAQNGAVDNTFVQFYPTLLQVAKTKGTLKNVP